MTNAAPQGQVIEGPSSHGQPAAAAPRQESASVLSHLETPCFPAFLRYPAFSCGVQRNSTRAVAGFLMGGLPRGRLAGVMAELWPVQKRLAIPLGRVYSVRTLNTEADMATRTHQHKVGGKWRSLTSHALCDDCGTEDSTAHQGRVTAPLPNGWAMSLIPSKSGGSTKLHYNCGCKAA